MTRPEAPPGGGRRERLLQRLTALGLLLLAVLLSWNQAAWVRADSAPFLGEDSHMNLARFVAQWQHLRLAPSWEVLFWPDYRAPAGGWLASLSLALAPESRGIEAVRLGQSVCAGLLALGSGGLCWRVWGRSAGLAGAALAGTFPLYWAQVNHVMLELPALGFLALALALQPAPGPPRWGRSLAGALCFGLAILAHKKSAFVLGGASAVLGLRALWLLARSRDRAALLHLASVLLYGCGALLVLPWLQASESAIRDTLGAVGRTNTEPLSLEFMLGMLAWAKHAFVTPPQAWAILAGLVLLPWGLRASPLVLPTLVGALGLLGSFRFPQMHERYWLPAVPALVLLMLLPTGLLARARRRLLAGLASGLHLALVPLGLAFQLLWQWPAHLPEATVGERWGHFDVCHPDRPLAETLPWLLARPTRPGWAVAPPRPKVATTQALAEAVVDHWGPEEAAERLRWVAAPGESAAAPQDAPRALYVVDPPQRGDLVWAELALRDLPGVAVWTLDAVELSRALADGGPCAPGGACLLALPEAGADLPAAAELEARGYTLLGRVSPFAERNRRPIAALLFEGPG